MLSSNESSYYKAGEHGIRIENLILVEMRAWRSGTMLRLETLTFCPIEGSLIDPELLSPAERAWLDAYHAKVPAIPTPQMTGKEQAWLEAK